MCYGGYTGMRGQLVGVGFLFHYKDPRSGHYPWQLLPFFVEPSCQLNCLVFQDGIFITESRLGVGNVEYKEDFTTLWNLVRKHPPLPDYPSPILPGTEYLMGFACSWRKTGKTMRLQCWRLAQREKGSKDFQDLLNWCKCLSSCTSTNFVARAFKGTEPRLAESRSILSLLAVQGRARFEDSGCLPDAFTFYLNLCFRQLEAKAMLNLLTRQKAARNPKGFPRVLSEHPEKKTSRVVIYSKSLGAELSQILEYCIYILRYLGSRM